MGRLLTIAVRRSAAEQRVFRVKRTVIAIISVMSDPTAGQKTLLGCWRSFVPVSRSSLAERLGTPSRLVEKEA